MKKGIILCSILIGAVFSLKAQPNQGFENWSTEFSYEYPDGWQTLNFMSLFTPPNPISAFKAIGTDKHSGNYALKLTTEYFNNIPSIVEIDDSTGGAYTGKITLSPASNLQGFQQTSRPEKLEFWAKYIPVGNDTGKASVLLQKWNGIGTDTIAFFTIAIPPTPVYTLFQIPIPYLSNDLPDTAVVGFGTSKNSNIARVGSALFVDDVMFTGTVGVNEKSEFSKTTKAFPSPAKDMVNITTSVSGANSIRIINMQAQTMGHYFIVKGNVSINLDLFAPGVYFYDILNENGKCISREKFTVMK